MAQNEIRLEIEKVKREVVKALEKYHKLQEELDTYASDMIENKFMDVRRRIEYLKELKSKYEEFIEGIEMIFKENSIEVEIKTKLELEINKKKIVVDHRTHKFNFPL